MTQCMSCRRGVYLVLEALSFTCANDCLFDCYRQLHLGMNATLHRVGTRLGERIFYVPSRGLESAIEVDGVAYDQDVVRRGVVVDEIDSLPLGDGQSVGSEHEPLLGHD